MHTSRATQTYCVRQYFCTRRRRLRTVMREPLFFPGQFCTSPREDPDHTSALRQLCASRHFIAADHLDGDSLRRGSHSYGPLGTQLKKNILEHWWGSVVMSRAQVFGISTLHQRRGSPTPRERALRLVDRDALLSALRQESLSRQELVEAVERSLTDGVPVRSSLLEGALDQYVPSLELVNRKLPFGLAETGVCYQPVVARSEGTTRPGEVTQASLAWFCSPRTAMQWLDYWARQRLLWWRKFALGPSNFSSSEFEEEEEEEEGKTVKGVRILYHFPWGLEPLETLLGLGDRELLRRHQGSRAKLQCRDERKSVVPHVISVSADMDRGLLAYLYDSLQQVKKVDSKQRLHQRKVLKLHPSLAPVKVALNMGRGHTMELRQVCEGLLQELLESGISVWPGYLETMPSSMEQLHTKYDEMGVLFTVLISDTTLENGVAQVRNRDTSIKEMMHVSEIKDFLAKYITAAEKT
ncbi:DNA polymerase subunit gamma-2 isoform X1 [Lepisosteus oculatus]|uniref:DNA polymerase subunit gamma-2 isoform X1 n=1 Tax=Lepisosteus oculatus TaxID=7918 RepID=UPI00371C4DDF